MYLVLSAFFTLCVYLAYEAGKMRGMNLGKKQILEEDIITTNKNIEAFRNAYKKIGDLSDIISSTKAKKAKESYEVYLREPGRGKDSLSPTIE
jgi:hypothetical protein